MIAFDRLLDCVEPGETGAALHAEIRELYPICRSITGEGLRETLHRLQRKLPLEIREVPSGTRVLDWTVPREWNIRDAYVKDSSGRRVVDFQSLNLHVLNYSHPVRLSLTLEELKPHLISLPDHPSLVPYRTSYYAESWGFCVSHEQLLALQDDTYEVCIDSTLSDGSLSYGELVLEGETEDEVLISTHACHPSLANDNLSGLVIAARLAELVAAAERRYTYRFLFIPGTIGAITWLARNEAVLPRIKHGLVLSGLGDGGGLTYKRSRRGDTAIDIAAEHVLTTSGAPASVIDFEPYGYDERQYCSPGFNLPVGNLSRTPYGTYPEYHTSGDNPDFVQPASLYGSLACVHAILNVLEGNATYLNLSPRGEPQLGARGLYDTLGGAGGRAEQRAMLWVLNSSDGSKSLLDIARQAGLPFAAVQPAATALHAAGLLDRLPEGGRAL